MSTVTLYRAFRTRCHAVHEAYIDDLAVLAIEQATAPHIRWMLDIPTIFTKSATPALARALSSLPYFETLNSFIIMLECYPASYHHGAAPELGIIVSFNHAFTLRGRENQANWNYKGIDIIDHKGRQHYRLADLPQTKSSKYPKGTFRP